MCNFEDFLPGVRKKCIFAEKPTGIMDIETRDISIRNLRSNSGEVEGMPRNPRKISKKNLEKLKKSVQDAPEMLRLRELIVIPHGEGYVVIAGNQRLEAARAVGMKTLPCKVLPEDTDPAKLREYAIKDNLPFGEDDWEVIASDWDTAELEEWGMDVPDKWKDTADAVEDDFNVDDVVEVVCQKYDVWKLGRHRLMCGDSTDQNDVAVLMDGNKADMVFTSPPYNGNNSMPQQSMKKGNVVTSQKLYNKGYADNIDSDKYVAFCQQVLDLCFDNTNGFIFWNVNYNANSRFEYISQIAGKLPFLIEQICWKKNSSIPFKGSLKRIWEPIYLFSTNGQTLKLKQCEDNLWEVSNFGANSADHNACFPVALPSKAINITPYANKVLDPFGGTGTTLIAAEQLNRTCYMMELDPHYCDVIIARWEKLTGKKATKIN